MNKRLFALAAGVVLTVGAGCSFSYNFDFDTEKTTSTSQFTTTTQKQPENKKQTACAKEGQVPEEGSACCAGLEMVAIDSGFSACGKPGTGYKPRVCAAPGEVLTADTPNCCAGLEPTEENNKWVCRAQ